MFIYTLSVAMADKSLSIRDPAILDLLKKAISITNNSRNSQIKGRKFELLENSTDEKHVRILLKSNSEVIPTRALSSLSRALIAVDQEDIISSYKNCIFRSDLLKESSENAKNLSDLELTQTILSMVFGQAQIKSNKEKELAKEYVNKIRGLVMEYLSQKML